mgnify:CR=1 FL=1
MATFKATLLGGGVADWGTFIPTSDGVSTFTYETEGTMRLELEGRDPVYLYGYLTGMDDINDEHIVTSGFGNMILTDIDGESIYCKVDWFWKDEQDQGTFTLWKGTGKWEGVQGQIQVFLRPALTGSDTRFGAFLEGEGEVELG